MIDEIYRKIKRSFDRLPHHPIRIRRDFRQAYDELKDYEKLTLEIKPYRAKRSLDANSYLWVLLDKLADKLNITRWQAYLNELKSHGAFEYIHSEKKTSIWHSQCSEL